MNDNFDKVQAVAWNPFNPQILLSCSFDRWVIFLKDVWQPSHAGLKFSVSYQAESLKWDPHAENSFLLARPPFESSGMAAGAAGDGLLRGVFEGCISGHDSDIQRRPYHKNCGCALHKSHGGGGGRCSHSPSHVSYPIRRSWSEGSVALALASSRPPSPWPRRHKSMIFSIEEEEHQQHEFDGEIGNAGTAT